jgi:hypothetical protein
MKKNVVIPIARFLRLTLDVLFSKLLYTKFNLDLSNDAMSLSALANLTFVLKNSCKSKNLALLNTFSRWSEKKFREDQGDVHAERA